MSQADQENRAAQQEVQKLRDAWDKTRLEATLYDQRAKRAYQKWLKSPKALKTQAQNAKEHADLELQWAVEKRKLAFVQWQKAVFLQAASEAKLKALDQQKDEAAIQAKIRALEQQLNPTPAVK